MTQGVVFYVSLAAAILGSLSSLVAPMAPACCPLAPSGKPVVNADQTVIIVWDPATKTEHFIRKASFMSDAEEFGFLIPSPSQPELNESGNEAFPFLMKLTEPDRQKAAHPSGGLGCASGLNQSAGYVQQGAALPAVQVLLEKEVAGFKAVVLESSSTNELVNWLKSNGYVFSPEVEAWAKPYVEAGWKITALKVAKNADARQRKTVAAAALRMSFKTDRPLFPYREPDSKNAAGALGANQRLLRIYFLADARYQGELTPQVPWTGRVVWANKLTFQARNKTFALLNLPPNSGPADLWLTEFEDHWPY